MTTIETEAHASYLRYQAAKVEYATLKAWRAAGGIGTEPTHPNLDALRAKSDNKNGGSR